MGGPTTMPAPAREKVDAHSEIETQEPIAPGHEYRSKPGRPHGGQVHLPEAP
jgi:hypothetical protein